MFARLFGQDAPPSSLAIIALPYCALVTERVAQLKRIVDGVLLLGWVCRWTTGWASCLTTRPNCAGAMSRGRSLVKQCGSQRGPTSSLGTARVLVGTYEKATKLVDDLVANGLHGTAAAPHGYLYSCTRSYDPIADRLACLVVDELQLLADPSRGYIVEGLLAKALAINRGRQRLSGLKHVPAIQVVGLSATLPNAHSIAQWLDAACVESTDRPIDLEEYLMVW